MRQQGITPEPAPKLDPVRRAYIVEAARAGALMDPLETFREGLELARRAGMHWEQAQRPAYEAALSVLPRAEEVDERLSLTRIAMCGEQERERRQEERDRIEQEREDWAIVLYDTRTAWMRAFEGRDTEAPGVRDLVT